MRTRKLGYTDLQLTTVGLGTWAIGGPWKVGWGPQDDNEAISAIQEALEVGINWIDTAPVYGLGHSEELVAKVLKKKTQKPLISTKCGLVWKNKEVSCCLKKQSVIDECHASLKRLGVEVIDLYQIHWPNPEEDIEFGWEAMLELVEQSKVRYIGVSNFNVEQMERLSKLGPVSFLQPPYSMIHREVEDGLLEYCGQNSIGVIAYSPMQRGLLTGKFNPDRLDKLAADDHRKNNPDFQQPRFGAALELVEQLKKIAARNDITCAQLAISWVLRRDEVTAAIVGARKPGQIIETAAASDVDLSKDDIDEIEGLLAEFTAKVNKN